MTMSREEWAMELAEDRSRRRACQCGDDMPGHCPGPENCPMCQEDDDEGEAT